MLYLTRTGQVTGQNSFTALTNDGQGGSGQHLKAPSGAIRQIIASIGGVSTLTASQAANLVLRLAGDGVGTEQVIPLGGLEIGATDTATVQLDPLVLDTNIQTKTGGEVRIEVSMTGDDLGTLETAIGLGFA